MDKKIQDVKPIYSWIVDSVVAKARAHFLQDGVDESVLAELKLRWEAKLDASDVYNAAEGIVEDGKEDTEGAKTPDDDSTGGENKNGGKSEEPQAKKRKIFTNDPGKVESPEAGAAGADTSGNGSVSDVEKSKEGAELDEDLDDDEPAEGESSNMVVAQYDKVVRNKNRWKCVMKHGIVHIDGREYVFSKATGEFVF